MTGSSRRPTSQGRESGCWRRFMRHNRRRMRAVIAGGLVAPMVVMMGMLGVAQRAPAPAPILNARIHRRLRDDRQAVPLNALRHLPRPREAQTRSGLRSLHIGLGAHRSPRSLGRSRPQAARPSNAAGRGAAAARAPAPGRRGLARARAGSDRQADAARSGTRDRAAPEPRRVQQHRSRSARRRHPIPRTISRRMTPATASTTSPTCCRSRRR